METQGLLAPETPEEAREYYSLLGPAAQTVVKETAKAMEFDREEYHDRISSDVIKTAREALFASLLKVTIGTRTEYDAWKTTHPREITEVGSEHVDNVVWHPVPFADETLAATFQDEQDAAVATLRRQAFGKIYRDYLRENPSGYSN